MSLNDYSLMTILKMYGVVQVSKLIIRYGLLWEGDNVKRIPWIPKRASFVATAVKLCMRDVRRLKGRVLLQQSLHTHHPNSVIED